MEICTQHWLSNGGYCELALLRSPDWEGTLVAKSNGTDVMEVSEETHAFTNEDQLLGGKERLCSQVVHPSLLSCKGKSTAKLRGVPILLMPLFPCDLQLYLDCQDCEVFPLGDIVHVGLQMCEGLLALHAAGIAHCDVSPNNIFVRSGSGQLVLADFGLAQLWFDGVEQVVDGELVKSLYRAPICHTNLAVHDLRDLDTFALAAILADMYGFGKSRDFQSLQDWISFQELRPTEPLSPTDAPAEERLLQRLNRCRTQSGQPQHDALAEAIVEAMAATAWSTKASSGALQRLHQQLNACQEHRSADCIKAFANHRKTVCLQLLADRSQTPFVAVQRSDLKLVRICTRADDPSGIALSSTAWRRTALLLCSMHLLVYPSNKAQERVWEHAGLVGAMVLCRILIRTCRAPPYLDDPATFALHLCAAALALAETMFVVGIMNDGLFRLSDDLARYLESVRPELDGKFSTDRNAIWRLRRAAVFSMAYAWPAFVDTQAVACTMAEVRAGMQWAWTARIDGHSAFVRLCLAGFADDVDSAVDWNKVTEIPQTDVNECVTADLIHNKDDENASSQEATVPQSKQTTTSEGHHCGAGTAAQAWPQSECFPEAQATVQNAVQEH